MDTLEIVALSEAIARHAPMGELFAGAEVLERRGTELDLAPTDPRHARVIVELDPKRSAEGRVKGVRVRLAAPEDARWDELEARFGVFRDQAELSGAPEVPPTRVATARYEAALPHAIRISVDAAGRVTGYVVRERYD